MLEKRTVYGGFITEATLMPITLPGAVELQLAAFLLTRTCVCVWGGLGNYTPESTVLYISYYRDGVTVPHGSSALYFH